ncbi:gliding motility-associated C-terminal domain-containing protein [Mucilaginibacter sabulilitoris]|uniref:Gliding motility-associated C-terminal domain-containing protein n=1 Tax=Mucilaginibacter sabulilitoris TaxID=1173583 RepID=A0ABZ0TQY0_9SPHI|nr:gliding motility-associated C-terminal domain-containing protein [Mucilaginibacter sabulilitoris]WPU93550.1 gliding motility-associated C-terminal domain-containing protein [Mucilaginibacter sabulilitoris]
MCEFQQRYIYIDGPFSSSLTFDAGQSLTPLGGQDVFIAKYNSDGDFQVARDISGSNIYNYGLVASKEGYIYLSGYFSGSVDFDPSPAGSAILNYHGERDLFLAKFDENINYKWAFNVGNSNCDNTLGRNVYVDNNDDVLLVGSFCSTVNFDASGCSNYYLTAQSYIRDSFLAKYIQNKATDNNKIISFSVPEQVIPAIIDQTNLQITIKVPAGTDVSALKPTISVTNGSTLTPASSVLQNFTSPVSYKLSSACKVLNYSVKVIFDDPVYTPVTICSGAEVTLNGDIANPVPTSYSWEIFSNNSWIAAPGSSHNKNYVTPDLLATSSNAVFKLRRKITVQGNINYDSYYTVTVTPVSLTNNNIIPPAVSEFCTSGNPEVINGNVPSGGNGTYKYQWQSSIDNINFIDINGATSKDYDPPFSNVGAYYRRLVTFGSCTVPLASNTVHITMSAIPAAPMLQLLSSGICSGGTASLSVKNPQPGLVYNWYSTPAKTTLLHTGDSYITDKLYNTTTYYAEAVNSGCSSAALSNIQVDINPLPPTPIAVQNNVPVCSGLSASLKILNTQAGISYNWYASATGTTPVYVGANFETPAIASNVTYYAEAVNDNGCASATRLAVNVVVNEVPQVNVQGTAVCPGTSAQLSATANVADYAVNWYADASGTNIIYTGNSFSIPALNAPATYYAEVINNVTGCVSERKSVQAQILQPLNAPVVSVDQTTPTSVSFKWSAVANATGYQVSIDNGQTFSNPSSGSTGLTHIITNLSLMQQVSIVVRALGNTDCELSGSSVGVTGTAASPLGNLIYVANAFTPNGDGNNDIVYVHSENIKTLNFYVYDQWGELIFTSNNQANGWDGFYKGTREPVGVYVYYLKATMNDGQQLTKKGSITLLR